MSSAGLETRDTWGLIVLVELVALAIALIGIFFSGLDLSLWSDSAATDIGTGVIGALLNFALAFWLIRSNTSAGEKLRCHCRDLYPLFNRYSGSQIVLVSLAAGICEELLFRGFLQPWLSQLSNPVVGLVGASLVFALLHYASFTYFVATLLVGLVLGICYRVTESLLSVMTWHAVYDLLVITVLTRSPHLFGLAKES